MLCRRQGIPWRVQYQWAPQFASTYSFPQNISFVLPVLLDSASRTKVEILKILVVGDKTSMQLGQQLGGNPHTPEPHLNGCSGR
ncbi:MAG: hypothetical protein ACFFDT_23695 [Candidatus Hodarchaeota archaeon]